MYTLNYIKIMPRSGYRIVERMDSAKVFMAVTAFISVVCFNFNICVDAVLKFVFANAYDESTPTLGPYSKSSPIVVHLATAGGAVCTNKVQLLVNWKWDFDIGGIDSGCLDLMGSTKVIVNYRKRYADDGDHTCVIDTEKKSATIDGATKRILFNEVHLI